MLRRILILPVVTAVVMGGFTATALASRLEGTSLVNMLVTTSVNDLPPVGDVSNTYWTFTPSCPVGSCDTRLDRQHVTSSAVTTYTLREQRNGTYYGVTTYTGDCRNISTGAVTTAGGQTVTETVTIVPELLVFPPGQAAVITKFHGMLTQVNIPNAVGRAAGCKRGNAAGEIVGELTPPPPPALIRVQVQSRFFGLLTAGAAVGGGDAATVFSTNGAGNAIGRICTTTYWTISGVNAIGSSVPYLWFGDADPAFPFNPQTAPGWEGINHTPSDVWSLKDQAIYEFVSHAGSCGVNSGPYRIPAGPQPGLPLLIAGNPITSISHYTVVQLYGPNNGPVVQNITTPTASSHGHVFRVNSTFTCTIAVHGGVLGIGSCFSS